jgi:hypothetical protein
MDDHRASSTSSDRDGFEREQGLISYLKKDLMREAMI